MCHACHSLSPLPRALVSMAHAAVNPTQARPHSWSTVATKRLIPTSQRVWFLSPVNQHYLSLSLLFPLLHHLFPELSGHIAQVVSSDNAISMPDGSLSSEVRARRNDPPRRGRGRPRKPPPVPNSKGLPSLPPELIGRIASFLIPPRNSVERGFAPPTELPYRSKKGVTQRTRSSPHGAVPSGVRDVLRLSQTCRQCERGVSLVVGKIGNEASTAKKR